MPADRTSWTLPGLTAGVTYEVAVSARNAHGWSARSAIATHVAAQAELDEAQALTAAFEDMPGTHDGTAFTFGLTFSEQIPLSYKTLRDSAFTVTGGRVTEAVRRVKTGAENNRRWTIRVQPDGGGDVTVALPAETDCSQPAT